jgi:hypothetical protein
LSESICLKVGCGEITVANSRANVAIRQKMNTPNNFQDDVFTDHELRGIYN